MATTPSAAAAFSNNNNNSKSLAWLGVFLPALAYFLSTRASGLVLGRELGETVASIVQQLYDPAFSSLSSSCVALSECLFLATSCTTSSSASAGAEPTVLELKYPLQLVHDGPGIDDVVDMLWQHDSELGRGYLLMSSSAANGRIWRWEVGGGPIAIGKTLHLDQSGCRSGHYQPCVNGTSSSAAAADVGSGAIATDFYNVLEGKSFSSDHAMEGALVISEWGEGRIVRLEGKSGARTPILMHVPCLNTCQRHDIDTNNETVSFCRLPPVQRMLYTPTGDLIVAVTYEEGNNTSDACRIVDSVQSQPMHAAALIRLPYASHVKPLESLQESRRAHEWPSVRHKFNPTILYSDRTVRKIRGLAVAPKSLYLTVERQSSSSSGGEPQGDQGRFQVLEISIDANQDDTDDDDDNVVGTKQANEVKVVVDLTDHAKSSIGAIAVSQKGTLFVATDRGVVIVGPDSNSSVVGLLTLSNITALALGGDGYLYVATTGNDEKKNKLHRIRTRERPVALPTDQVHRPPKALIIQ
jgi:hypothetical protein